ncbi:chemotaxis response regulator protein-glutamate methylesterase [Cohnella pontilimi]|uniref:Protein-glutamate methylesterase/protein-glutamine glutaminase n=1 Tax=Cohnella pontilimi TaxID=2564100 RepID=A0A4U0FCY4_9BACL|nr:chemotaxis response regulator protein-glutamate methylesterase [Cohnella pontilimi]TJY42601.1 chemotaxis response regulator protein-glutamate methylesterase [Cohnella pontilimi]
MPAIKVLVVDDSLFMRKLITRLIDEDGTMKVIGSAMNGLEAVKLTKELLPDVVTMDIEMPYMNGLDALAQIMKERPTPIVMLSSLTEDGAAATITALQHGAVDFIRKPAGSISVDLYKVKEELAGKIKAAAQSKPVRYSPVPRARMASPAGAAGSAGALQMNQKRMIVNEIVAIGTSTGGPRALETVISSLPENFAHPILVVQHMPPKFTYTLARRLDASSGVRVVEAEDNQLIQSGTAYIAPGDSHMKAVEINGELRIQLSQEALRSGHRPSVDVLFESVAKLRNLKRHLVIMTGMGSDGAKGMLLAKESGAATTIAEAEETCVVYGMPKCAVELGCVDHLLPLDRIAGKIVDVTKTH